jgi:hypothetical protein
MSLSVLSYDASWNSLSITALSWFLISSALSQRPFPTGGTWQFASGHSGTVLDLVITILL